MNSQNSQKKTSARVLFLLKLQAEKTRKVQKTNPFMCLILIKLQAEDATFT